MFSQVQDNDTLLSIGAHFEMGPSELKQLNKLMSSHLYTGQVILCFCTSCFVKQNLFNWAM